MFWQGKNSERCGLRIWKREKKKNLLNLAHKPRFLLLHFRDVSSTHIAS